MSWKIVSWEFIKGGTMRYLKPLRPFFAWSQLSIPTVYDDSLSYYEVLNKCIFHFNEMLKIMQENYEIIDEAFAKILEECEAAIARCEEAAARAEAAQSAAEKAQAAAEAAQAAAEAAQKLAEAAQAAAEAARDDAVTAQKAAEAAQAAAEAAQAAAEAAQKKAETAQAAAEAAQAKAEDAQEKAESARDAAQAAQTAAEAAQQKAEEAQTAAESARDAAEAAQRGAEAAQEAAEASEQAAADSAADAAASAEEIKKALDNYYDKTESDNTFVKKAGDTMTGNLVMEYPVILDGTSKTSITPKVLLIPKNTDLNNFLKPGSYSCVSTNVISTIKNMPENRGFLLINSTLSTDPDSETITFQTFIAVRSNNVYTRFIQPESSILTDWNKLIGGEYLPLSGGTMTGNITMSNNSYLVGNSNYIHNNVIDKFISESNYDLNMLMTSGYYESKASTTYLNKPTVDYTNSFIIDVNIVQSVENLYFGYQMIKPLNSGYGVYYRSINRDKTWNSWVRLDNITEEPTNGTPIFYKRVYSTDSKFFANIYKIAGNENKAKVDIYVNNLDSGFNLSFSTDYETFPAIFKIDGTQSTFKGENLPFELKSAMDLVVGNYMVEKSNKYIGLVILNYNISFSGYDSYIKPYFNGILLESSVLSRGTISGNNPIFITSFINDVNSRWTWD